MIFSIVDEAAVIEEYSVAERKIFHFDLYRLADAEELEWIGIDDYLNQNALCFIEWAEKGTGVLPDADIHITLTNQDAGRLVQLRTTQVIEKNDLMMLVHRL